MNGGKCWELVIVMHDELDGLDRPTRKSLANWTDAQCMCLLLTFPDLFL